MGLQRTPLFPMHQKYKGKLIDFGGWELPVEYQGIISEHKMVRSKAGMFDVSHMGEVEVTGERSLEYLNNLLTNDFTDMAVGQIRYSPMCYEHGGVVDDLMVCKFSPTHYFLVINAANTKKDLAWMQEQAFSQGVTITDVSDSFAEIALQGPLAQEILQPLCDADLAAIKYYYFLPHVQVSGVDCLLSRCYQGRDRGLLPFSRFDLVYRCYQPGNRLPAQPHSGGTAALFAAVLQSSGRPCYNTAG
jgi:aminomethyltransferase